MMVIWQLHHLCGLSASEVRAASSATFKVVFLITWTLKDLSSLWPFWDGCVPFIYSWYTLLRLQVSTQFFLRMLDNEKDKKAERGKKQWWQWSSWRSQEGAWEMLVGAEGKRSWSGRRFQPFQPVVCRRRELEIRDLCFYRPFKKCNKKQ